MVSRRYKQWHEAAKCGQLHMQPTTEVQELKSTDRAWMEARLPNVTAEHTKYSNGLEAARRNLEAKTSAGENESALAKLEGNPSASAGG